MRVLWEKKPIGGGGEHAFATRVSFGWACIFVANTLRFSVARMTVMTAV